MALSLQVLLEKCRAPTTMENCEDFVRLQTLCETTNDFVKDFSKISFRGGHERYIEEVVRRLDTFLRQRKYVVEIDGEIRIIDIPACRKIFLFLLVNTKVAYDFDLENDEQFCHCLNRIPQFSQCLFTNVIWGLNFDQFMYEFLAYVPSVMVLKWIDEVGTSVRYGKPFQVIERCSKILDAVVTNLALATQKNISQAICVQLVDSTASLLSNFNSPAKDIEDWTRMEKHKFFGYMTLYLLELAKRIIELWKHNKELTIEKHLSSIYNFTVGNTIKTETLRNKQILEEFAVSILITLETQIMLVTFEMYVDWCEIDMPDPQGIIDNYSLQSKIGYCVNDILEANNSDNWHDVFTKLESMRLVRPSTEQIAKDMQISDLIEKLEPTKTHISSEDKKILFREFISRGIIYNNEECLEVVTACEDFISYEEIQLILATVSQEVVDDECQLILGNILSKAIEKLSCEELIDLIHFNSLEQIVFSTKIDHYVFVDKFEPTKIFRAIFKDPDGFFGCLSEIICNSQKFAKEAHINSISNFVKTIEGLMPVKDKFKAKLISTILKLFTENFKESISRGFLAFFQHLYKIKFFSNDEFVKLFIADIIEADLTLENQIRFNHSAKIVAYCIDWSEFGGQIVDICITYGKILNQLRLNLKTFGNNANEMIENLIAAIQMLLEVGKNTIGEKETEKIYAELESCCPSTMYYFLNYLVEETPFDEFLLPNDFDTKKELTQAICNHLSQLSIREMRELIKNQKYIDYFTNSMHVIMMTNVNEGSPFKLQVCFKNYLVVYQEITQTKELDQFKVLMQVISILHCFKDDHQEFAILGALPHIQKQLETILSADPSRRGEIEHAIRNLKDQDMIQGLIIDFFDTKLDVAEKEEDADKKED